MDSKRSAASLPGLNQLVAMAIQLQEHEKSSLGIQMRREKVNIKTDM